MEVVLQNQDFRSIEIMENNLQLQKNEVSLIFIVIRDILPVFPWKVTWNFRNAGSLQDVSIQKTPMSSVDMFWNINRLSNSF